MPEVLKPLYYFQHIFLDLESFHNLVLAYASKRTSFQCVDSILNYFVGTHLVTHGYSWLCWIIIFIAIKDRHGESVVN